MASEPIVEQPIMWRCQCGARQFNHYGYCPACGNERPPPQAAKPQPLDTPPAAEVAWQEAIESRTLGGC